MSNAQQASLTKQVPQPSTPDAEKRHSDTMSLEEAAYKCTCGTPDTSENWICCDDDDCPIGWYHWECVRVTEDPPGDWLCPRCSLKSIENGRLPNKNTSMFSKPGKTAAKATQDTIDHHAKEKVKNKGSRPAKKGIAVKKSTPKKKAKWVECVKTDSDGEEKNNGHEDSAQEPVVVAEERRTKTRGIKSKSRVTRSRASTSNLAAKMKTIMAESGTSK